MSEVETEVLSPLTHEPTRLVNRFSTATIIEGYRNDLNIDVSKYFENLQFVSLHECNQTGFQFYYPLTLAGASELYEKLEAFDWNYKSSKWEFLAGIKYIRPKDKILDVGCGEGAFVQLCKDNEILATGLELNPTAAKIGSASGRDIRIENLRDHSSINKGTYDVVTSFQVLEHVDNPKIFLTDCLNALRDGGILIIGVPNNDAFLKHTKNLVLNMPPHHMGLWKRQSLEALQKYFPLDLLSLQEEPLTNIDWFAAVQVRRFLRTEALRRVYYRLKVDVFYRYVLGKLAPRIRGHTILAVYKKTGDNLTVPLNQSN
jgi:2-polyprenyl-3-methyl-5-hydroxy-6-metoxy-1,4-benzoquinol methylase